MADTDSDDMPSHSLCATKPIDQESFTEQNLRNHLASLSRTKWAVEDVLQGRLDDRYIITQDECWELWEATDDGSYTNATYEVYEIPGCAAQKCIPEPKHKENGDDSQEVLSFDTVWDTLKEVNTNGEAVGRIT